MSVNVLLVTTGTCLEVFGDIGLEDTVVFEGAVVGVVFFVLVSFFGVVATVVLFGGVLVSFFGVVATVVPFGGVLVEIFGVTVTTVVVTTVVESWLRLGVPLDVVVPVDEGPESDVETGTLVAGS
ncbi:MAG: hypothetical protein ACR2P2_09930 [Nakamurella sp.]